MNATVSARWAVALRGTVSTAPTAPLDWHLVLARQPGWQSVEDWQKIAQYVRDIEPRISPFIVRGDLRHSVARRQAARRPSLVFSPGPLTNFNPLRGRVYQGGPIPKLEQLRRLAAAGVPVPRTAKLTPDLRLDPAVWGDFVIVKPSHLAIASYGQGIQLMRTSRLRFKDRDEYPRGHPGRAGPMIVQQFIDTGERIALYRVLSLFGEPLYVHLGRAVEPRVDLAAPDEAIESAIVATQATKEENRLVEDPDVIAGASGRRRDSRGAPQRLRHSPRRRHRRALRPRGQSGRQYLALLLRPPGQYPSGKWTRIRASPP